MNLVIEKSKRVEIDMLNNEIKKLKSQWKPINKSIKELESKIYILNEEVLAGELNGTFWIIHDHHGNETDGEYEVSKIYHLVNGVSGGRAQGYQFQIYKKTYEDSESGPGYYNFEMCNHISWLTIEMILDKDKKLEQISEEEFYEALEKYQVFNPFTEEK